MNKKFIRIIPKLDIKNGLLIKGINLDGLRVLGDPFNFAENYYHQGADEISYVDSVASLYGTNNLTKFVTKTSKNLFIPLSVGGGIRDISQIENFLNSGADKVSINSAAIQNVNFINKAAKIFGSSTITCIIEVIKIDGKYFITKENGRDVIDINPFEWAKRVENNGAGEIFLTSINHEGLGEGFDINLTKKVAKAVRIPVIVHGGAGKFNHVFDVINQTDISGVSIAGFFHYDVCSSFKFKKKTIGNDYYLKNLKKTEPKYLLKKLKNYLLKRGVNLRK